jgi:hypothetical protein
MIPETTEETIRGQFGWPGLVWSSAWPTELITGPMKGTASIRPRPIDLKTARNFGRSFDSLMGLGVLLVNGACFVGQSEITNVFRFELINATGLFCLGYFME